MPDGHYAFDPAQYRVELEAIIVEIARSRTAGDRSALNPIDLQRILRRYPKDRSGLFSKSEIVRGFRHLQAGSSLALPDLSELSEEEFLETIRMKPVRTASGVAPVTVLTKPYPCPGRCIFCPSDVRMPKSYLSDEPGAQRAAQHQFDPYAQTLSRLLAYYNNGHRTDKVELIILGGTWSYYDAGYQVWFVTRCFEAMNDFEAAASTNHEARFDPPTLDFRNIDERIDGRSIERNYNRIVGDFIAQSDTDSRNPDPEAQADGWRKLAAVQQENETAAARCVGLVVETRPDHLSAEEVIRIRRLGATKVQIGFQSLSDQVLELNHRGHDVAATRRAVKMLRAAGFKIHAHWMPNLYGSSPELDVEDFDRIFADPDLRPDELKIYPCSLIESAELMSYFETGAWQPYDYDQLLFVLGECVARTPRYCRLTRVIRDIPGTDIVAGNRLTNFRELVEADLDRRSIPRRDIRSREIRRRGVVADDLRLVESEFSTSIGHEVFLEFVTRDDRLCGFLRLSLPSEPVPIAEIGPAAMIREVHVYGVLVGLGDKRQGHSQHVGLGRQLVERATAIARQRGYADIAVISSIGTRDYYRRLGFHDGELYQQRSTSAS